VGRGGRLPRPLAARAARLRRAEGIEWEWLALDGALGKAPLGGERTGPFHTAGFSGTGLFRIFDVWESEEDWQRFNDERFMPAVAPIIERAGAPPSVQYTYELHDVVKG
jgi:hypothetical protein